MEDVFEVAATITALDEDAMQQAKMRQQQLTKPAGSLGRLEEIAVQMAGITRQPLPRVKRKAVMVMAADHGVVAEGVSAYPSTVTPQMVLNFLHGGAAINALARQTGAEVVIVDVGVATDVDHPGLLSRKVARGTANMAMGPAMTREQALAAISVGMDVVKELVKQGIDLLATGDMGIGNTTAASAITANLTGTPVALVTGRGTGIDERQLAHKIHVIERALAHNVPDPSDPLDVLTKVGGLEIAGLVGGIIAGAASRIPVVIDGFIAGAAALLALRICPAVRGYLFAGHVSVERGHHVILEQIGLSPLLDLQLRLGEGTGAVLATHIIDAALGMHSQMATFTEAGVSNREDASEQEIDRTAALAALHERMRACRLCQEHGYIPAAQPLVGGRATDRIMVIGQAPGHRSVAKGRSFSGPGGSILQKWLEQAGFPPGYLHAHTYLSSLTHCDPGRNPRSNGDRRPSPQEIALCRPFLEAELQLVKPKVVLLIGTMAIETFFGKVRLEDVIGTFQERDDMLLLPLPHPSGVSRWLNEPGHQKLHQKALEILAGWRVAYEL